MELISVIAMLASLCSLFLHGYTIGRLDRGKRERPQPEDSEGLKRSEKMQEGVDSIMTYEGPGGLWGGDR